MTLGAAVAGPWGTIAGGLVGLINVGLQLNDPSKYDNLKVIYIKNMMRMLLRYRG